MAETLKSRFDRAMITRLASALAEACPGLDAAGLADEACLGLDELELTDRARQVSRVLAGHLPRDYGDAVEVIIRALGPPLPPDGVSGFEPFMYLPLVYFVAEHGLPHLEASLRAQRELTRRFTAEFSIRTFLEHHPDRTLATLEAWARDPDPHVRRLVSEGTRPRLPWAPRLRAFQRDPSPVLRLLEHLKDDPSLYVRRSVANNLNDIGKDHPELLTSTCRRWMTGATPERRWLVEHALRGAVKKGDPAALELLGHGRAPKIEVLHPKVEPRRVPIGSQARLTITLASRARVSQALLVDLGVHFVKARGETSVKVFKLRRVELPAGGQVELSKSISFAVHSTRRPYPGRHAFDVRVNGAVYAGTEFTVVQA